MRKLKLHSKKGIILRGNVKVSSKSYDHSGVHVFRNGALLVIDCSGCLYCRTERQVCNFVLLLFFKSGYIDE